MRKRILIMLLVMMSLLNSYHVAYAVGTETKVIGNVQPSIIKVSAPVSVMFSINPNEKDSLRFISSTIEINNETNAAIEVKIAKGKENFALDSSSLWRPQNVSPNSYEWGRLGYIESESYLALGVVKKDGLWKKTFRESALFVQSHNNSNIDISFGEIEGNSLANLGLVCKHGLSFRDTKEAVYRILWTFSLGK